MIASTHRVYTIGEKSALGDGRADAGRLAAEVASGARAYLGFDMAAIAEETGALISAVLLGAVAGAAVLPFGDDACRAAIRATGKAVDANLAAFEAGAAAARAARARAGASGLAPSASAPGATVTPPTVSPATELPVALAGRIDTFPDALRPVLRLAVTRLVDYQDPVYAAQYLDRVAAVLDCEPEPGGRASASPARPRRVSRCG